MHCLPKKVIVLGIVSKGIFTIKSAIVLRAGFWMSMVYCLIAYFFARQKLAKILQFPIFDGSCMKLVSFDQNFIDWHTCKSQTHLSLLKDKEKLLLILLGNNGSSSDDQLCSSWVFKEFFKFLSHQNNILLVFFILLVHYQQASRQLVSTFRRKSQRLYLNRDRFWNCPWSRSPHLGE